MLKNSPPFDPGLAFVEPMLATLVDKPPAGESWSHEIKYDGYRTQIAVSGGEVRVYTRKGYDWTKQYRQIADGALELLEGRSARIDGEIIVQDASGRPDFHALRSSITSAEHRLVFKAFDLIALDGRDLRRHPCSERRALLAEILTGVRPSDPIQLSEDFGGSPSEFLTAAEAMGLEGIVSKRRASSYQSGRSRDWLKIKTFTIGEFVVIGYERPGNAPATLLVASELDGELNYAGRVMNTLGGRARDAFWTRLEARHVASPAVHGIKRKGVQWVRPGIRVKVRHLRGEENLRHATMVPSTSSASSASE